VANVLRTLWSADDPTVTRRTVGTSAAASAASRSASKGSERRRRGSGPAEAGNAAGRSTGLSSRLGNSETPVTISDRVTSRARRAVQQAAASASIRPVVRAAFAPPTASMSRNLSQATSAIRRVRSSTYQDPPAGSTTEARALSSNSSNWVLRAVRRPNSLGRPRPESKGRTVTASAPPTPAAKAATVPRSRLPHGSRQVRSTVDPLACWTWPQCSSVAPLASATRAHSRRAARSRQMVRNWSASADQVKEI